MKSGSVAADPSLTDEDLAEYEALAVDAAKQAGELIASAFYKMKAVEHKGAVDLVTETDKSCEELILKLITEKYPHHKFIGEEGSAVSGTAELSDEPTWMVDPLDGTTNFVHMWASTRVSGAS